MLGTLTFLVTDGRVHTFGDLVLATELASRGALVAANARLLRDAQRDQVRRIRSSGDHLLAIVEEILTYASLEAGRAELYRERTDVGALVRQVVTLVEPQARAKGLTLCADVPEAAVALLTDVRRARQILINLLVNAIKFTDRGEGSRFFIWLPRDFDSLDAVGTERAIADG